MGITLSPRRAFTVLLVATLVLTVLSAAVHYVQYGLGHDHAGGLVPLFSVQQEANLPTWFSSACLLLCAVPLGAIAALKRAAGRRDVCHWAGLALVFVFLSADETAMLHDRVKDLMGPVLSGGGIFFYSWVIPWGLLVLAVGLAYLGFLGRLPARTRNEFLLAAALYVGGALVLELVEGAYRARHGYDVVMVMMGSVEEFLEMLGALVFLRASLNYLAAEAGTLEVRVADGPALRPAADPGEGPTDASGQRLGPTRASAAVPPAPAPALPAQTPPV